MNMTRNRVLGLPHFGHDNASVWILF